MKRILITGCAGFLAGHLLQRLRRDPENQFFGISDIPSDPGPDIQVFKADIRDPKAIQSIMDTVRPDLLFHFAAVTNVAISWRNPRLTYEVNYLGTSNLLDALQKVNPRCRVLAMGSAEIYRNSTHPLDETAEIQCSNPYALSKYAMEMLIELHMNAFHLQAVVVRSFNFTGPGQERRFVASDFAAQIAAIEKGNQEPLLRVGNLEAIRDFSDVRDIARYIEILNSQAQPGSTYNLCSGNGHSIRQILDILLSLARVPIRVEVDADRFRPLDNPFMRGDCSRLRRDFRLESEFAIEQTLGDLLEYWRKRT